MSRRLCLITAVVSATGLIAAGCGGNDDESSDTGTEAQALTKGEFVAEANQICTEGTAELNQLAQETLSGPNPPSAQEREDFVTGNVVPNIRGQIEAIRELGIPAGDEDQVNGMLDDAQALLDELEENPSLEGGDLFKSVNQELTDYGISACAG